MDTPFRFARLLITAAIAAGCLAAAPLFHTAPVARADEPVPANYIWSNDPISQFLAGRPGPVLHRAPGTWFSAPEIPAEAREAEAQGQSLYGPGTPVEVGDGSLCTLTVAGYDASNNKIGITSGHCGGVGAQVRSIDSPAVGQTGTVVYADDNLDYSVIEFNDRARLSRSYNGVEVNELGGPAGIQQCKHGLATGETCGIVWGEQPDYSITHLCSAHGDSGAPVTRDGHVVGLVRGGLDLGFGFDIPCRTPLQGALHTPTVNTSMDSVLADINSRGQLGRSLRLPD